MLERLRQRRTLHAVIFTALLFALLVPLLVNAPTRMALAQLPPVDICSTEPGQAMAAQHGLHGDDAPAAHAHHHVPDCLLCLGLATPPPALLAMGRSPVPLAHQVWRGTQVAVPVWRALAPLPARGPPGYSLA